VCAALGDAVAGASGERLFEAHCKRVYPRQTGCYTRPVRLAAVPKGGAKCTSAPAKGFRTFRQMFLGRPRLRTAGTYRLTHKKYKNAEHDMFTTLNPDMVVLEMSYYRYFRFFDDGRCLYALTPEKGVKALHWLNDETGAGNKCVVPGVYVEAPPLLLLLLLPRRRTPSLPLPLSPDTGTRW
jgi:hypothetical protein